MEGMLLILALSVPLHPEVGDNDLKRFPSSMYVKEQRNFGQAYRRQCRWLRNAFPWREEELSLSDYFSDRMDDSWALLQQAQETNDPGCREYSLSRLRETLGCMEYAAGRLPPIVPYWRFSTLDWVEEKD